MAAPVQSALRTQKRAMRKAIGAALVNLPTSSIDEQSEALTARVLALPAFRNAKSISCYLSMPSGEINTSALVDAVLGSGKRLFVPKIQTAEGIMDFLPVYSKEDLASCPSGTWGIKEPEDTFEGGKRPSILNTSSELLDVILLPGVAFDSTLSRLGHGKGYYDRFISAYVAKKGGKPFLVGLSLREQRLDAGQVPIGEHDWKVDVLVTPDETFGDSPSI